MRITGSTVGGVMTAKDIVSKTTLASIAGKHGNPTVHMRIGTLLEPKVLALYSQKTGCLYQKNRQGLVLLEGYPYVGHTPDKLITSPERLLVEVKVVFSEPDMPAQEKKHKHQIQLGLVVHKCDHCVLVVYHCKTKSEDEALEMNLDAKDMHVTTVKRDPSWYPQFQIQAQAVYNSHLEWMYRVDFDKKVAADWLAKQGI